MYPTPGNNSDNDEMIVTTMKMMMMLMMTTTMVMLTRLMTAVYGDGGSDGEERDGDGADHLSSPTDDPEISTRRVSIVLRKLLDKVHSLHVICHDPDPRDGMVSLPPCLPFHHPRPLWTGQIERGPRSLLLHCKARV